MFAISFLCHLAIFSFIIWSQSSRVFTPEQAVVTYVDMVTLPVASPQSGSPAPAEVRAQKAPAPAPAPVRPPAAMALPAAKPKAKPLPAPKGKAEKPAPVEDAREFSERMEKIERQAEEKRQAEVLARLRKGGGKAVGMPGAKGTQAGSDYSSYIQSRVQDAIDKVAVSQTNSPMVIATISIGPDGQITDYHVDKTSGDPLFDEAVKRAVTLAGKSLVPPPGGAQFKGKFRFRQKGAGVR
jgi:colicin import membrane protein